MRKKSFVVAASVALILLSTLTLVNYASSQPIQEQNRGHNEEHLRFKIESNRAKKGHNVPVEKGWVLNIVAEGTAFNITDLSMTRIAQVSLNATVEKVSMGRVKLKVIEGELKIGDTIYTIEKGVGLITVRNGKILIHLKVVAPDGAELHVVLKGKVTGDISSLGTGETVDVDFTKPQSKIVRQFFLELSGTLKRVA